MNIKEINPLESWNLLQTSPNSILIDVRTTAEFNFTGIVDLETINKQPVLLPWRNYPDMKIDNQFSKKLVDILQEKFPSHKCEQINLLFLCRSGGRSFEAATALALLGYQCHNINSGFEGETDQNGHRGKINGWKADNLPWRQS